jgi:hypothetical protein
MSNKKKRKSYRVRDISVSDSYTVGELKALFDGYYVTDDTPVVLRCGGKNFRICSDTVVIVKNQEIPVIIGTR